MDSDPIYMFIQELHEMRTRWHGACKLLDRD